MSLKTNNEYRQFLIHNTNMIMTENCQPQGPFIQYINKKAYPYLFHDINDNNQPPGYKNSLPKQNYIEKEKIDSTKINILKENI